MGSGGLYNPISSGRIAMGVWQFVAVTYDGAAMKVYINGVLGSTHPYIGTISPTSTPLYIGNSPGAFTQFLDGEIDEVGVWNRALSDAEITMLYELNAN